MPLITKPQLFLFSGSASNVAAGSTVYVGPGGTTTGGAFLIPRNALLREWRLYANVAPGVGQTYTCTFQANINSDSSSVATFSGGAAFDSGLQTPTGITITAGWSATIKIVTSASATPVQFRGYIILDLT